MNYRTFFPDRPPIYYRLLSPLPLIDVFPSVTYPVSLQSVLSVGRHELVAHDASTGVWPTLSPSYHVREFLEQAVFRAGFPVRSASIAGVIVKRLARERRAAIVPPRFEDLTDRRPNHRQRIGAWIVAQPEA